MSSLAECSILSGRCYNCGSHNHSLELGDPNAIIKCYEYDYSHETMISKVEDIFFDGLNDNAIVDMMCLKK